MKSLLISIVAFVFSLASLQLTEVEGIIIDRATGLPIPYVDIFLDGTTYTSDIQGEFKLLLPDSMVDFTIEINHMGYKALHYQMKPGETFVILNLEPIDSLRKPAIFEYNIIEEVVSDFDLNYNIQSHRYLGDYKEQMFFDDQLAYDLSGRVEIFIPHVDSLGQQDILVHPISGQRNVLEKFKERHALAGNAADMANSSIWRDESFLHEDHNYKYNFEAIGFDKASLKIIKFEPIDTSANSRGHIFIDTTSMAILRIEYEPIHHKNNWNNVQWTETFTRYEEHYYLSDVYFEGEVTVKENEYRYYASLSIDSVSVYEAIPKDLILFNKDYCFYHIADINETIALDSADYEVDFVVKDFD